MVKLRKKDRNLGVITKCYSLTPSTIKLIADYARRNECTQSNAVRALVRIALNKIGDDDDK